MIVSADEREFGLRRVLNFGHTVGHALEAVTKYRRFRHGEAVAYGMLAAMALGVQRGVTPRDAENVWLASLPNSARCRRSGDLSAKEIVAAIGRDKKIVAGNTAFHRGDARGRNDRIEGRERKELKAALQRNRRQAQPDAAVRRPR